MKDDDMISPKAAVVPVLLCVYILAVLVRVFPVLGEPRDTMGYYGDGLVYYKVTEHLIETGNLETYPYFNHPEGQALQRDDPTGFYRTWAGMWRAANVIHPISLQTLTYFLAPALYCLSLFFLFIILRHLGVDGIRALVLSVCFIFSTPTLLRSHALFFRNEVLGLPVFFFVFLLLINGLSKPGKGVPFVFVPAALAMVYAAWCWDFFSTALLIFVAAQWGLLLMGRRGLHMSRFLTLSYVLLLSAGAMIPYMRSNHLWGYTYSAATLSTLVVAALAAPLTARCVPMWRPVARQVATALLLSATGLLVFAALRALTPAFVREAEHARYGILADVFQFRLRGLLNPDLAPMETVRIFHGEFQGASLSGFFDVLPIIFPLWLLAGGLWLWRALRVTFARASEAREYPDTVWVVLACSVTSLALTVVFRRTIPLFTFFAVLLIGLWLETVPRVWLRRGGAVLLLLSSIHAAVTFSDYYQHLATSHPVTPNRDAAEFFRAVRHHAQEEEGVLTDWTTSRELVYWAERPTVLGTYWQNPDMVAKLLAFNCVYFSSETELARFCAEVGTDYLVFNKQRLLNQLDEAGYSFSRFADPDGALTPRGAQSFYFPVMAGAEPRHFVVLFDNDFAMLLQCPRKY